MGHPTVSSWKTLARSTPQDSGFPDPDSETQLEPPLEKSRGKVLEADLLPQQETTALVSTCSEPQRLPYEESPYQENTVLSLNLLYSTCLFVSSYYFLYYSYDYFLLKIYFSLFSLFSSYISRPTVSFYYHLISTFLYPTPLGGWRRVG